MAGAHRSVSSPQKTGTCGFPAPSLPRSAPSRPLSTRTAPRTQSRLRSASTTRPPQPPEQPLGIAHQLLHPPAAYEPLPPSRHAADRREPCPSRNTCATQNKPWTKSTSRATASRRCASRRPPPANTTVSRAIRSMTLPMAVTMVSRVALVMEPYADHQLQAHLLRLPPKTRLPIRSSSPDPGKMYAPRLTAPCDCTHTDDDDDNR
ncbi:hypothetical protein P3342_002700 [Pyrenophora teres f. teres]|nr:hypothetical protein P3342_002700 [Pyrenophora teres f. teres]